MTLDNHNREKMRRYLLGQLGEAERTQIEDQYSEHDDYFHELKMLEDQLVDSYVRDKLSPTERALFEKQYLSSSYGLDKVTFVMALMQLAKEGASSIVKEAPGAGPAAPRQPFWPHLVSTLPRVIPPLRPAIAFALAVVMVVGSVWLGWQNVRRGGQITHLLQETQTLEVQLSAIRRQVDTERGRVEDVARERDKERNNREKLEDRLAQLPAPESVVVLLLSTAARSKAVEPTQRLVPATATLVRFELDLERSPPYTEYRLSITRDAEQEILQQLVPPADNLPNAVVLLVDARLFRKGTSSYQLTVEGIGEDGRTLPLEQYHFQVTRQ